MRKRFLPLLLLLIPTAGVALQPSGRPPLQDSLATWYALGINAHHLCAGYWVVGRDHRRTPEAVIAEDIARFPAFRWQDTFTWQIDSANFVATVTAPGVGSRSARYNGDQGCAILPAGSTDVYFTPIAVKPNLPDPRTRDWPTGDRNAHATFADISQARLDSVLDWAFNDEGRRRAQNTRGVVVIHRGRIIAERYAPGWGPQTPQISWSAGKSIAATLIGVLVQQGKLRLDQPAPVPEWQGRADPRRNIRISDLLRMSSGLDFDNFGLDPNSSYNAANEHFRIYFDAVPAFAHAVHQPLRFEPGTVWRYRNFRLRRLVVVEEVQRFEPGTVWRYRNSDPLTLMYIARRTVESSGGDWLSFPQRQLFDRIGARSFVLETDAWGDFIITGFDFGGTRDWARLGLLYLQNGVWEGERILPGNWAEFVSTPSPGDPARGYGGLFWLNRGAAMPRLPEDAYWMAGYMGQYVVIIPSRDLVVARQGPSAGGDQDYIEELVARILAVLPSPAR